MDSFIPSFEGKKEDLLKKYQDLIQQNPKNYQTFYERGLFYYSLQDYSNSFIDFTHCIRLNNKFSKAFLIRGILYKDQHENAKAISDFTKSISLEPEDLSVRYNSYNNRGLIYVQLGKYDQSLMDFNKALEISNYKDCTVYYNRGLVYKFLKDNTKAVNDFSSCLDLNPLDVLSYHHRGICYGLLKKYDNALKDFSEVIKLLGKNDCGSYFIRGYCYCEMGQYGNAINDFTKAIALNKGFWKALYFRGWIFQTVKQKYDKAIIDYTNAINSVKNKENCKVLGISKAYYNRGVAYSKLRQYQDALNDFNECLKINPDDYEATYNKKIIENHSSK